MRLWHTVRHLRPAQVWGRVWRHAHRPGADLAPAPPRRERAAAWQLASREPSMTGPATFRFLNVERTVESAADWERADWPRLWQYNLHYFDDLAADDASTRASWHTALVDRWLAENPPGRRPAWEPYPTSLRIVNWIKSDLAGGTLSAPAIGSLAVQTRWLRRRLEIHLLGNHLWANAKALVFAGAYFDGDEADRWIEKGLRILRRELREQVFPDGGHFERSPMYHAIVTEDVLDLLQLARLYPRRFSSDLIQRWRETVRRMLHALRVMSHPDGQIALFNDAAFGIAPSLAALTEHARRLGLQTTEVRFARAEALHRTGYVRLERGPAVLIADVGKIGPKYLPGHAHADTLSFELSLDDERVFVNGGTSTYDATPERLRQRGTAAHNTVVVNDTDSSEVWSSFRVARRALPHAVSWGDDTDSSWVRGSHDGYERLRGVGRTSRTWRLSPTHLVVLDGVAGLPRSATARFHLNPKLRATMVSDTTGTIDGARRSINWQAAKSGRVRVTKSTYHPRFGVSEDCDVLEVELAADGAQVEFAWRQ